MVEHLLAKEKVAGSIPVSRSKVVPALYQDNSAVKKRETNISVRLALRMKAVFQGYFLPG